jgi:hypothetical protein
MRRVDRRHPDPPSRPRARQRYAPLDCVDDPRGTSSGVTVGRTGASGAAAAGLSGGRDGLSSWITSRAHVSNGCARPDSRPAAHRPVRGNGLKAGLHCQVPRPHERRVRSRRRLRVGRLADLLGEFRQRLGVYLAIRTSDRPPADQARPVADSIDGDRGCSVEVRDRECTSADDANPTVYLLRGERKLTRSVGSTCGIETSVVHYLKKWLVLCVLSSRPT